MIGLLIVALWYGVTIGLSYYFVFGDMERNAARRGVLPARAPPPAVAPPPPPPAAGEEDGLAF